MKFLTRIAAPAFALAAAFCSSNLGAISTATDFYKDDFDGLAKIGVIRALVVYDGVNYFFVDGRQDGLAVALMSKFKKYVNEEFFSRQRLKVDVQFVPVREDQVFEKLIRGEGDIAANFIIPTEKRSDVLISYTQPLLTDISEYLVTGINGTQLTSLRQLSGRTVYIRKSSRSYDTFKAFNLAFETLGWQKINIVLADEAQQDAELVERVQSGEVPAVVINSAQAKLWEHLFPSVQIHTEFPLSSGETINWAVRTSNPRLLDVLNRFISQNSDKTQNGKRLISAYLRPLSNSAGQLGKKKNAQTLGLSWEQFQTLRGVFQKYGKEYVLDWRMLMCQAYKESTFKQSAVSRAGAVGILQVSPKMAMGFLIKSRDELDTVDGNVRVGTMYMRYILDHYFNDFGLSVIDKMSFALAGYNAGPGRIAHMRKTAAKMGLDGDKWFGNVELVAAEKGLDEPVKYVSEIMKCHQAYAESEKATSGKKKGSAKKP